MALVIEDGTLIAGATSYIDITYIRAYAAARGRTVPANDAPGNLKIEQAAILAMDAMEAREYAGSDTYPGEQTLAFPRFGIAIGERIVAYDTVPENVRRAQAELTLAVLDGKSLLPTLDGAPVKREKVGPLETEYVIGTAQGSAPVVAAAEALLKPYLRSGLGLRTERV